MGLSCLAFRLFSVRVSLAILIVILDLAKWGRAKYLPKHQEYQNLIIPIYKFKRQRFKIC